MASISGYIVPGTNNARWRESPFWPVYFSYLIVYVDPDYETALVGYPGHAYAWVLARAPTLDDATYEGLLDRFRGRLLGGHELLDHVNRRPAWRPPGAR